MHWKELLSISRLEKKEIENKPARTEFEKDYDRIIFSSHFRKLQDKTQVFPLPRHDFVHTRLTHSLEVSSVGRSLGKEIGMFLEDKYPTLFGANWSAQDIGSVVAVAALAHDIGNPPFGHSGEKAISDFFLSNPTGKAIEKSVSKAVWKEFTNFEGNAQGFRILTRGENQSLRLTLTTLAAFTKYPTASAGKSLPGRKSQKKYGMFSSEHIYYQQVAEELGLTALDESSWIRHPLAFLTEAADDICYHIIDLEDSVRLGIIPIDTMKELIVPLLGSTYKPQKFDQIRSDAGKAGILRALAIGKLIQECAEVYKEREDNILSGEWDKDLFSEIVSRQVMRDISTFSLKEIYKSRQVLQIEIAGFQVLQGLLEELISAIGPDYGSAKSKILLQLLPSETLENINATESVEEKVRNVLDFICALTDRSALAFYRNIKGIEISGYNAAI